MKIREKIISYGKKHPKSKYIIITLLVIIIFVENLKKALLAFGKKKTTETAGGEKMSEGEEWYKEYITSVRNIEYDSDNVKQQFKPLNRATVIPVVLVCVSALCATGLAGKMKVPKKVNASENQITVIEEEANIVKNESVHTTSKIQEEIVIDNDLLPWYLILINDDYAVPEEYEVELVSVEGKQIDVRIEESLKDMLKAAKTAGMNAKICSGYRTAQKQEQLVKKDVAKYKAKGYDEKEALELTYLGVAPVNHSEHQTGLAVDIVSVSHQSLDAAHANTKEAIWLKEHCKEYGFIVRYMEGKEDITNRKAESWHFRYVGVEAATYIMENDITLEEYLEEYVQNN
ncbi:MAG: M15 family metallopeptidase [Lachnospiraceae bacterium]|nr:M15 family metallopeptidase [Lachnospiraceae bacterium]